MLIMSKEIVQQYTLTALSPWAWHGLAVPSGTTTLNDVVNDTAVSFATAYALGMSWRSPCLPCEADYRSHLANIPFKTSLFFGNGNQLNRPLAKRLNFDFECGMQKSIDLARKSGNIKDYFYIQEVSAGSKFHGYFLHADPLQLAEKAYNQRIDRLVIRLGLGRSGIGLLEKSKVECKIFINLHTAYLFNREIDIEASSYRLHNIQPSRPVSKDEALQITSEWF